ncbi:MAG: glycoside hydrolase [Bacteroidetes bacterium RIFOXYB2_FULL_35_7]|nr:MAG: glycoside hydrolase [Bacteroidetes bacterium RIFOXYB2_FULL_35_7]
MLKSKPICKATFTLTKEVAHDAQTVCLCGDFNNWDYASLPMKKAKDGSYSVTIELTKGNEYQFRYLLDGVRWENDWDADKYVPTAFGDSENSVVVV